MEVGDDQHPGTVMVPACSHFGIFASLPSHGGGRSLMALSVAKNQSGPSSGTTTAADTHETEMISAHHKRMHPTRHRPGSNIMDVDHEAGH